MAKLTVYLAGEIHSDWRDDVIAGAQQAGLDVEFLFPVTDHPASDAAGDHLGENSASFWRDHQSAKVNALRNRVILNRTDIAVVRFGGKYKQWNAAFDAGYCAASDIPYITLHDEDIVHALKEVDAAALAWCQTPQQVVATLAYVMRNK